MEPILTTLLSQPQNFQVKFVNGEIYILEKPTDFAVKESQAALPIATLGQNAGADRIEAVKA